jgi:hypothetical protein
LWSLDLDQTVKRRGQAILRFLVNTWTHIMIGWQRPRSATIDAWVVSLVVPLAVVFGGTARAGLTVDITKVTCRRAFFIGSTTTSTNSVALWLDGYYSGQHGRTVIDMETLQRDADKIKHHCRIHRDETIMKAAETVLGTAP